MQSSIPFLNKQFQNYLSMHSPPEGYEDFVSQMVFTKWHSFIPFDSDNNFCYRFNTQGRSYSWHYIGYGEYSNIFDKTPGEEITSFADGLEAEAHRNLLYFLEGFFFEVVRNDLHRWEDLQIMDEKNRALRIAENSVKDHIGSKVVNIYPKDSDVIYELEDGTKLKLFQKEH